MKHFFTDSSQHVILIYRLMSSESFVVFEADSYGNAAFTNWQMSKKVSDVMELRQAKGSMIPLMIQSPMQESMSMFKLKTQAAEGRL